MKMRYVVYLGFCFLPLLAAAQDGQVFKCELRGNVRTVTVVALEPGQSVPCEVRYTKDSEDPGSEQVLWRASNESGYCEARAQEFLEKLEGWGWSCDAASSQDDEENEE